MGGERFKMIYGYSSFHATLGLGQSAQWSQNGFLSEVFCALNFIA